MNTHTKVAVVGASPLPMSAAKSATAGGEPLRREKSVGADGRTFAMSGEAAGGLSLSKVAAMKKMMTR